MGVGPMRMGVTADGRPIDEPTADEPNFNVGLGVDVAVVSWLALGVEGRGGSWDSQWSTAAGYVSSEAGTGNRSLFDLDAVMRFRSPLVRLFPRRPLVFSLAPSIGYTWPQAPSRVTRAVTESWQPRTGSNAGIELTCETWFTLGRRRRWPVGAFVGVGYLRHWLALDAQMTPGSQPDAAVSARYEYVTDQILFKFGALTGLL
jgi:hypothetical protein